MSVAEMRAYAAGRQREIDLTTAALAMLPCVRTAEERAVIAAGTGPDQVERDAAQRAGLPVLTYRHLVARVDSVLREDAAGLDPRTRLLDSLRVQLTVLRTRMSAEQAQTITHKGRQACVAHS